MFFKPIIWFQLNNDRVLETYNSVVSRNLDNKNQSSELSLYEKATRQQTWRILKWATKYVPKYDQKSMMKWNPTIW